MKRHSSKEIERIGKEEKKLEDKIQGYCESRQKRTKSYRSTHRKHNVLSYQSSHETSKASYPQESEISGDRNTTGIFLEFMVFRRIGQPNLLHT